MAFDLEDAYNRVQFKLLLDLLLQHGVSPTLTRWIAAAFLQGTGVIQLGNWNSVPRQLTMGLPQGSPFSSGLFNVNTTGSEAKSGQPGIHTGR